MERIYDTLQRITQLWKKLELTKPNTSEYVTLLNQIRVLSDKYEALIDAPKKPSKTTIGYRRTGEFVSSKRRACDIYYRSGQRTSQAGGD